MRISYRIFLSYSFQSPNSSQIFLHPYTFKFIFLSLKKKYPKHGIQFVLATALSVWGLLWSMVDVTSVTSLRNQIFPFLASYCLQIVYWLGVNFVPTSPLLCSDCLAWDRVDHVHTIKSLSSYYICPVVSREYCFLKVVHHFWIWLYFHSLLDL